MPPTSHCDHCQADNERLRDVLIEVCDLLSDHACVIRRDRAADRHPLIERAMQLAQGALRIE